jgi:hypothetical protein
MEGYMNKVMRRVGNNSIVLQQRKMAIILAVVDIYILDFVINIGMSPTVLV